MFFTELEVGAAAKRIAWVVLLNAAVLVDDFFSGAVAVDLVVTKPSVLGGENL